MIHVSFTELRKRLGHFMDLSAADGVPILIIREGSEPFVLVAQSDYEGMRETLHLAASPANAAWLDASIAEAEAGEGVERTLIDP